MNFIIYELLPLILNMSLTASIVVIVILFFRLVLKKAPKVFSYFLWIVVLFRLVCPIAIQTNFSFLRIFITPTISQNIVHNEYPMIEPPLPTVNQAVNTLLPQVKEQLTVNPLKSPMVFATIIWLFGITSMLIYSVIKLIKLQKQLICALPLRDNIYLADHINSPFVMGVIKPKIYLPSSLTKMEQEFIIAHEKHHIKCLDHITRIVSFIALTIHWFNPLVWLAFILSGKDMEMSCDEAVMKEIGTDIRAEYSQSLLRFASGRTFTAAPLPFGEGDTKDRVINIMKYKKSMVWVSIVAVMVVICVTAGLISNPKLEHTSRNTVQEQLENPDNMPSELFDDNTPKKLTYEQAVALAITSTGNRYLESECMAEGHIILGYDDSVAGNTKIYALTMIGWYGFKNNNFVKVSGSGVIPAVVTLYSNNTVEIEFPQDGTKNKASTKTLFPQKYHKRIFDHSDSDHNNLKQQELQYAKEYLEKLSRNAKIGEHSDFEYIRLTHVGVSTEVSNKLDDFYKKHSYYPDFIGTSEYLEDGLRVVYEMSYHKDQNEIRFTKYAYDSKVEQFIFNAKTGAEHHINN